MTLLLYLCTPLLGVIELTSGNTASRTIPPSSGLLTCTQLAGHLLLGHRSCLEVLSLSSS